MRVLFLYPASLSARSVLGCQIKKNMHFSTQSTSPIRATAEWKRICGLLVVILFSCVGILYYAGSSLSPEERAALYATTTARALSKSETRTAEVLATATSEPNIAVGQVNATPDVQRSILPTTSLATNTPEPTDTPEPTTTPTVEPTVDGVKATAYAQINATATTTAMYLEYYESENCKDTGTVSPCLPPRTAKLEIMPKAGWTHIPTKPWARREITTFLIYNGKTYLSQSPIGSPITVHYRVKNLTIAGEYRPIELIGTDGDWVIFTEQSNYIDAVSIVFSFPDDGLPLSERAICINVTDWRGRFAETSGIECNLELLMSENQN
jgi:hypothetical protein